MKTMTALRMGSEMVQISFIWIIALIIAPSYSEDFPRIKNLDCVNDLDKKIVCFWEVVNRGANCSSEFRLKYTDFDNTTLYCQDLDNEYDGDFRVPGKCVCNITVNVLIFDESYDIEVESHGKSVSNTRIKISSTIKPKPPSDLRVDLTDPENGVIHWKKNYENSIIKTTFHIQFISKEDDKMVLQDFLQWLEPRYMFSKRQLTRGHEYRVRVRTKSTIGDEPTRENWSEWSPKVEFRNDYDLTIMENMRIIIPVSSICVLLFIVFCYYCITRTKEKWWNNIPDPARSKLVQSKLLQKNSLKPAGKPTARKSCGKCLIQFVKAHKTSKQEQFSKEHPSKDNINLIRDDMKIVIFEPEKVDIESCIQLYPREDDNLYQEDSPEDKEEDFHLMAPDLSIGQMFSDILCDSSTKVEALDQLHIDDTFGSSILWDHFQKSERRLPLSMVSQESGYQSYDSDDSPGDSKSTNALYFDHPLCQGDFLPYAPVSSINVRGSQIEDEFVNSGYNSFANALAEATKEEDNISVFSLGSLFSKHSYHYSLQNAKGILYYNRKSCPTYHKDDFRPTMASTSDYTIEMCSNSASEVSGGYQSFNQALQQGDTSKSTTCFVFDSGYKPFESLTSISTNSLDNIGGLSEFDIQCPYQDSVQNNEDLPRTGMNNGWTYPWNDSQSSDINLTEFNFFVRKYPFCNGMLGDEYKGSVNQDSDINYSIDRTLQKADKPLSLTFDINDHLRNIANMQGPKMSKGLGLVGPPTKFISFPCSQEETPVTLDGLHTDKDFPMKFENKSYFFPVLPSRVIDYSQTKKHLLVEQNNIDKEGNLYMKITLW